MKSYEESLDEAALEDYNLCAKHFDPAKLTVNGLKNVWIGTFKQGTYWRKSFSEKQHEAEITEDFFLKIIRDWKHSWMNQTQNDQKDYENYHRRAFGIDANMVHSLANRIVSAIKEKK